MLPLCFPAQPDSTMSSFSFPENYGLVFGGLFATAAANLYCAINVSIHR